MVSMTMGDVHNLSPEDRKKWSLQQHLKLLRANAAAADQGSWSRSHSVVQSWDRGMKRPTVICLAEGFGDRGSQLQKYVGHGWDGDVTKESPNTRHIVNCSPRSILRLLDKLYELYPDLKAFD